MKTYSFLTNQQNAELVKARDKTTEILERYKDDDNEDDKEFFSKSLQSLAKQYKVGGGCKTSRRRRTKRHKTSKLHKASTRRRSKRKTLKR